MQRCYGLRLFGFCAALLVVMLIPPPLLSVADVGPPDDRLEAARQFVESSQKYLHHSKLRRGMKGYGLTVMAGTERVRFDVEIISVMTKWAPHQDVILAMLSKQDLEKTRVIMGMSGSPCYIRHEGRDKLIGAVAFGFAAQTEPLCGIQPITQMLAAASLGVPQTQPATRPTTSQTSAIHPPGGFLEAVVDPGRSDFLSLVLPKRPFGSRVGENLRPLLTPLMVSGLRRSATDRLGRILSPMGMVTIPVGGMPPTDTAPAEQTTLVPGGAVSIVLASGDADITAVGTVTDVQDGRVLAFGHEFLAGGDVTFPMGPAFVHTVISGLIDSFKLGSALFASS